MEEKEDVQRTEDCGLEEAKIVEKNDPFKKPQICLVGPRKSKGAKIRVVDAQKDTHSASDSKTVSEPCREPPLQNEAVVDAPVSDKPAVGSAKSCDEPDHKPLKPRKVVPAQKLKETPIPYLEPKWGGIPPEPYSLDVIKSGLVLEPINLSDKSYYVFGRQTNCDVQMAHPTVSRHHAVLQYSKGTDDKPQGFYLFDLGSTHGTFLNKNRVRPEMFIRIKVGHLIKLGGSTRQYLLQGPPDDMEDESELTVTELRAKRQSELQARELAEQVRKQKEEEEQKKREEEGIDWGMGDDADEETDLSENPYATTTNEELYIDDPKKTLRGWFEREGHELDYEVEEKGPGQFLCRVDVPVEGARGGCMVAEALVKGKKKEAVAQCALEACRLLDRLGLLRQATHESRKRKAKNWEEEDFYDSDDDTFLDRTGVVEKKRQQRMKQLGKAEEQVETYQSLSEKHTEVLRKLENTQAQLRKAQDDLAASKSKEKGDDDTDSLESFMSNLSQVGCVDKKLISHLKSNLAALHKEEAQLRKLVNIAKPTSLPELVAPARTSDASQTKDTNALKNKLMLAARKKANEKNKVSGTFSNQNMLTPSHDAEEGFKDSIEEEEKDVDEVKADKKNTRSSPTKYNCVESEKTEESTDKESTAKHTDINRRVLVGPAKPTFIENNETPSKSNQLEEGRCGGLKAAVHLEKKDDEEGSKKDDANDEEKNLREAERRKKRNRRRMQHRNEKALDKANPEYDASDPNYSVWVPPDDQTGDGTTKLNAKLGY